MSIVWASKYSAAIWGTVQTFLQVHRQPQEFPFGAISAAKACQRKANALRYVSVLSMGSSCKDIPKCSKAVCYLGMVYRNKLLILLLADVMTLRDLLHFHHV